MYESLGLEYKIRWTEDRLNSAQKSIAFWETKEASLRQEYGDNPAWWQCAHIRKVKQNRKSAQADLVYWTNELESLRNKLSIYRLFS